MVHLALLALLACSTGTPDSPTPQAPSIDLPGSYEHLKIPTSGAVVHTYEGDEMVLHYPGAKTADVLKSYIDMLHDDSWQIDEPQNGGRFVRVQANKGEKHLEFFVVRQPERTEVHLEWVDK
jgi:hypothetical protein